jgi:ferredoxin-NADP reductase
VADVLTRPVRAIIESTPTTRVLRVDLQEAPFVFRAGQAALIGAHGQAQRRPYSIASSPSDAQRHHHLEFLLKVDAAADAGFHFDGDAHPDTHVGTTVDLEGPFGSFTLPDSTDAPGFLFVAGGTGIAPLRSMLRHLIASGETRPIAVLYSARRPDEFAYGPELKRLAARDKLKLLLTVTGEANEWNGERGRIGLAQLAAMLPARGALAFICGPPSLVEDVPPLLLKLGASAARIRIEEWG